MHIWIDIEKIEHVPFISAVVNELKVRGHVVILTAPKSKKLSKVLENFNLTVHHIGKIISFFGLFLEFSTYMRTVIVLNYLKGRNINVAFSCGSKIMFLSCVDSGLPAILFVEDYKNRACKDFFLLKYGFFILPDSIQDQNLIEAGFDLHLVAKYKGTIQLKNQSHDLKTVKEIVNKIEFLSQHLPGEVTA